MDVGKLFIEVCNTAVCSCAPYSSATNFIERSSHLSKAGSPGLAVGSGYENPGNENIRIVANLLSLPSLLRFFSALRRAGAVPEGSEGYPSELRAAVHSTCGNNLGYAMLPRLFPLYRLFIFFVMDELKSAHLF